jgi:tetratricopeptide (TPR) repeat protein
MLGLGMLLGVLFLGGCSADTPVATIETQERQYLEANTLAKQGRTQEALAAYLKVIAKRGDQAPESHLNVGIIYLEQIKDPIAAIYYFRRYLELVPNSKLGDRVKGLIETAKRDFARSLPVQPQDNIAGHLDGLDQIERLQRQNDELNAELASLRAGMALPPVPYHAADSTVDGTGLRPLPGSSDKVQVIAPNESVATAPETSSADDNIEATAAPAASSTHAGRTHTIVKGDTWYNLAKKYYGSGSKWPQIVAANRDQLKGDHPPLKVGMVLKIP